jgi:hypothetical protein
MKCCEYDSSLLNISLNLSTPLGVTKVITIITVNLVTLLCCVSLTYVSIKLASKAVLLDN